MNFCNSCGYKISFGPVPDDNLPRHRCENCGIIHYINPKVVVGCLPVWADKILLCKRGIEPRLGKWTLPAGFMEMNETANEGAIRETIEETKANVEIKRLFSVFSLAHIGQVYLIYLADLKDLNFSTTPESLEIKLFNPDEIPWDEIAFTAIKFSLKRFIEWDKKSEEVFIGESEKRN